MIWMQDHQVRRVHLDVPHAANVKPSWFGESVGHYEGDTLVIDTVGIKQGPFAMVDMYGTPFSDKLRVVLIFDIWHPHLTPPERAMITALTAGMNAFLGGSPDFEV